MKTLYVDIEVSPNIADVWGLWNQTVSLSQLRESARMICFAAKWKGEKRTLFFSEYHCGRDAMLVAAHGLLDAADAVVTYNGKNYDIKHLNREFALAGLGPPSPSIQLDLYLTVKRQFKFPSNKLDYVANVFGLGRKLGHEGHMLWVKCMAGDAKAWATMRRYNIQDVALLEKLDERLTPWRVGAPNLRLDGAGADVCPLCGSAELVKEGYALTTLGKYQRFHCRACGAWSRSSKRTEGTDIRG